MDGPIRPTPLAVDCSRGFAKRMVPNTFSYRPENGCPSISGRKAEQATPASRFLGAGFVFRLSGEGPRRPTPTERAGAVSGVLLLTKSIISKISILSKLSILSTFLPPMVRISPYGIVSGSSAGSGGLASGVSNATSRLCRLPNKRLEGHSEDTRTANDRPFSYAIRYGSPQGFKP